MQHPFFAATAVFTAPAAPHTADRGQVDRLLGEGTAHSEGVLPTDPFAYWDDED